MAKKSVYRKHLPKTVRQAFLQAKYDPELISLREEVAIQRAMLANALEQWGDKIEKADPKTLSYITTLVANIRDTVRTLAELEGKLGAYMDVRHMPVVINMMVNIIKGEIGGRVSEPERILARISKRFGEIPLERGSGGTGAATQLGAGQKVLER